MGDSIYIVDPKTRKPVPVTSVSFSEINIKERKDLEEWVVNYPEILGEPLLIVTTEYDRFDQSGRRLDVLAIDKQGVLVVIELKLDAVGSLADQQAIRYAAFCSTMSMRQAVECFAHYHECSEEDAEKQVLEFLEIEELPELNDRPRIILAAGSIDDQELTSCVLWLRRFGVDITCIELTPYRMPSSDQVVLVPRTIIPLPEARDYIIKVEQKEVRRVAEQSARSATETLWRAIGEEFNKLGLPVETTAHSRRNYLQVRIGSSFVHYEWMLRKKKKAIEVAIHFESPDTDRNDRLAALFQEKKAEIERGVGLPFTVGRMGQKWARAGFLLSYDETTPPTDVAPQAADLMKTLVERTLATLQTIKAESL